MGDYTKLATVLTNVVCALALFSRCPWLVIIAASILSGFAQQAFIYLVRDNPGYTFANLLGVRLSEFVLARFLVGFIVATACRLPLWSASCPTAVALVSFVIGSIANLLNTFYAVYDERVYVLPKPPYDRNSMIADQKSSRPVTWAQTAYIYSLAQSLFVSGGIFVTRLLLT